jgi:hypothetical protein
MKALLGLALLMSAFASSGCAVVRASADVVSAAGNLVGVTARTTADVVKGAAGGGGGGGQAAKGCSAENSEGCNDR